MPLPPEYVELLSTVIDCLTSDTKRPLRTADEITEWLHRVAEKDVRQVVAGNEDALTGKMVQRVLENTHHPLLSDWTPEQIADWCHRTSGRDVRTVFEKFSR